MKKFFLGLLVAIAGGSLVWSVYGVNVGGFDNLVQTIKQIVITSDGMIERGDKSNVIIKINDPALTGENHVYIKKGAFKNGTITKEDIDWSTILTGADGGSLTCPPGYVVGSVSFPHVECVYNQDHWRLVDEQHPGGAVYYSGRVAVDVTGSGPNGAVSVGDFGPSAQFIVRDRLSPSGVIIVGKRDKHLAFSSDGALDVVDQVDSNPQLVMGASQPVSIGSGALIKKETGKAIGKLTVHGGVRVDGNAIIQRSGQGAIIASTGANAATIAMTHPSFFVGRGSRTSLAHAPWDRVAHAANTNQTSLIVGSTASTTARDSLIVHGGLSVRGQGEKGGLRLGATISTGSLQANGCKALSVDSTGKVVAKTVNGCTTPPPGF